MTELGTGALGPGRIESRELEQEMRSSYLDYAMSVIVGRALPDVRDGLKPVHRRVLYGMHEAGMQPNGRTRSALELSATSWAPTTRMEMPRSTTRSCGWRSRSHCATRLSTDRGTSARSTTIPPAAMRYTEARLSRLATELLRDIDADTVDFQPNSMLSRRPSRRFCRPGSPTFWSTARLESPWGWRRTSHRTTSRKWLTRSWR